MKILLEPLTSYEKAIGLMESTTTETGLDVFTTLTDKIYEKGQEPPKGGMESLSLIRNTTCPQWNYEICPQLVFD